MDDMFMKPIITTFTTPFCVARLANKMSNNLSLSESFGKTKTFHLELEAELLHVSDVLKAVLHTILFNRLVHLKNVREASILGITYCYLDEAKIAKDVNAAIKLFHQSVDQNAKNSAFESAINVSLHKDSRRGGGALWTANFDPKSAWETWSIRVNVHFAESEQETRKFRILAEKQLRACLFYISSLKITEIHHMPFLSVDDGEKVNNHHAYKISVPNAVHSDSWTSLLKKMLSESTIPSLLK